MHGFIAFGIPTQVRVGGPAGDLVSAIGWSNMGGRCRGQTMLTTSGDRLVALKGYFGVQGHSAQYLAILAQCRVAAGITDHGRRPKVHGRRPDRGREAGLQAGHGTDLRPDRPGPLSADRRHLDQPRRRSSGRCPRLVEEEIVQTIRGAPCGGTHRLFGLAYGCQRRLAATGQLDGVYLRADQYVRDYQNLHPHAAAES